VSDVEKTSTRLRSQICYMSPSNISAVVAITHSYCPSENVLFLCFISIT